MITKCGIYEFRFVSWIRTCGGEESFQHLFFVCDFKLVMCFTKYCSQWYSQFCIFNI